MFSLFGPRVSAAELAIELKSPNPPKLLDVRENEEVKVSKIPGAIHIPLAQLPDRVAELDSNANWVVYCRSGGRSASAVKFLSKYGIKSIRNLDGGLMAYARDVDRSMKVL